MSIISELGLAGTIGRKGKIKGNLSTKARLTGHVAAGNTLEDSTQTFILVDEDGHEIPAVFVDEEIEVTATVNDIRLGTTAVTGEGVVVGEKEIPAYYVSEGHRSITTGRPFIIPAVYYDYTKLQAVVCRYGGNIANSLYTEKVVIEDYVYKTESTDSISKVVKDHDRGCVDLGISNDSNQRYVIRYFMYREVQ